MFLFIPMEVYLRRRKKNPGASEEQDDLDALDVEEACEEEEEDVITIRGADYETFARSAAPRFSSPFWSLKKGNVQLRCFFSFFHYFPVPF